MIAWRVRPYLWSWCQEQPCCTENGWGGNLGDVAIFKQTKMADYGLRDTTSDKVRTDDKLMRPRYW